MSHRQKCWKETWRGVKAHLESPGNVDVLLHKLHTNDFVRFGTARAVQKGIIFLIKRRLLDGGFVFIRIVGREHVQVHGKRERISILLVRSSVTMHPNYVVGNTTVLFDINQIQYDKQQIETRQERILDKVEFTDFLLIDQLICWNRFTLTKTFTTNL